MQRNSLTEKSIKFQDNMGRDLLQENNKQCFLTIRGVALSKRNSLTHIKKLNENRLTMDLVE